MLPCVIYCCIELPTVAEYNIAYTVAFFFAYCCLVLPHVALLLIVALLLPCVALLLIVALLLPCVA